MIAGIVAAQLGLRRAVITQPGTGSVIVTGYAPTLAFDVNAGPGTGHITVTGHAPTLSYRQTVTPATGHIALTGHPPTLGSAVRVPPATGHVTVTGYQPTVTLAATADPVVWSTTYKAAGITLANSNRDATSAANSLVLADNHIETKGYWEVLVVAKGTGNVFLGVALRETSLVNYAVNSAVGNGFISNGTQAAPLNTTYTTGDRIGFAFDPATGGLWVRKNGTWLGNDPSGAAALTVNKAPGRKFFPFANFQSTGATVRICTSAATMTGATPTGYSALSAQTFPDYAWNASDIGTGFTLSENNTKATRSSGTSTSNVRMGINTLATKQVWAVQIVTKTGTPSVGLGSDAYSLSIEIGANSTASAGYRSDGVTKNSAVAGATLATFGTGDIIHVAYDKSTRHLWFGKNGTWNGDPAADTGFTFTMNSDGGGVAENYRFPMCTLNNGDVVKLIDYPYTVPTGFTAVPAA